MVSTRTPPGLRPERMPLGPRTICRTSEGCPSIVKTTSLCRAREAGESANWAPWDCSVRALEGLRA